MTTGTVSASSAPRAGHWLAPASVAILSILALGGFEYLVLSVGEDSRRYLDEGGRTLFTIVRLGLSAVVLGLVVTSLGLRQMIRRYWIVLALTTYYFATYFWSVDQEATAGAVVRLVAVLAIGMWIAGDGTPEPVLRRLVWAAAFFVAINVAATLAFTDLAFMRGLHEGAWRGALSHKNQVGLNLTLAGLIVLCRFLDAGQFRWLALYGLCWLGIVMSQSASAIVVSAFGLALTITLYAVIILVRRSFVPAILLAGAALALASVPVILQLVEIVSSGVGRDMTFTGRTSIWAYAVAAAERGGLFGYGYQAFWSDLQSRGGIYGSDVSTWSPNTSHNGLLDGWLAGGSVGLVLILTVLLVAVACGYRMTAYRGSIGVRLFPLAAIVCLALYNFFETLVPSSGTLAFALITVVLGLNPGRTSA